MDRLLFQLTFWITVFGLILCTGANSLRQRRMSSSDDDTRLHRRRSLSLANYPGPPGQSVPTDAVHWALQHQACYAKDIVQNVTQPNCEPKTIQNKMCYGVCATFHLPRIPGSDELEMCSKCQPAGKRRQISVTLKCVGGSTRTVTVSVVDRCACSPCNTPIG